MRDSQIPKRPPRASHPRRNRTVPGPHYVAARRSPPVADRGHPRRTHARCARGQLEPQHTRPTPARKPRQIRPRTSPLPSQAAHGCRPRPRQPHTTEGRPRRPTAKVRAQPVINPKADRIEVWRLREPIWRLCPASGRRPEIRGRPVGGRERSAGGDDRPHPIFHPSSDGPNGLRPYAIVRPKHNGPTLVGREVWIRCRKAGSKQKSVEGAT